MRFEDPRENPDYKYGDTILDYAERAEKDASDNRSFTVAGEIKLFLAVFLIIKSLHDLFLTKGNTPEAVAEAWLAGEGKTVSQDFRDRLESLNEPNLLDHLLQGLNKLSDRMYNSAFDLLRPMQRLEVTVQFLGLSLEDFQRRTFEGIVKQSVVKDTAEKLEQSEGDYSKLL